MNIPPLSGSLVEFFELLLQSSLRGTLMAGGVLALQTALGARLSPRWRYALWLAVAAALLLPPIIRPAFDVTPLREMPVVRYVITPEEAEVPVPESVPSVGAPAKMATPLTGMEIAAAIWFSGVVVIAATWLLAHCLMMRRFRRDAFTLDAELLREIEQCAAAIGLRRIPDVLHAPAIPSPAVTGFLRGTLLLPADVQSRFTPAERRYMLLHELAHLRRGDLISNWLINALLALHWFNPALWFAAARLRADRESACDATVLHHTRADERSAYGHTLLKLHAAIEMPHRSPAFVGILERGSSIRQRILHIAGYGNGRKAWGTVAAIATVGLLSCLGVRLYAQPAAPAAQPAQEAAAPRRSTLEQRLLERRSKAQQVEIAAKVFTIDPAVGPLKVGDQTLATPKDGNSSPLSAVAGVLTTEGRDQLLGKLASTKGVESIATPGITARHGQRAVIEIIRELRYATEWTEGEVGTSPEPKTFETRNTGMILEVETSVALQPKGGQSLLDMNVAPQLVYFAGWRDEKLPGGGIAQKPTFINNRKVTTSVSIYDGHHVLLWWHMELPEGKPWDFDPDLNAAGVKTRPRTVLWVLSPRILKVGETGLPAEFFKPANWETKDASVDHLLMHFKEQSRAIDPQGRGLNLVLAKPVKEPPLVSLDLKGVSLIGALEHAFKAAGMRVEEQGDNTLVITGEPR